MRLAGFALVIAAALVAGNAGADIVELKDGNILEIKITGTKKGKDKRDYYTCTNELGEKKEYAIKDIKWRIPKKPSWEVRAENQKWYEIEKAKPRATWNDEAKFAAECRKRDLDAESGDHFRKAYELRKATIKDEEKDHKILATWLEKEGQIEEALDEMRAVLACRRRTTPDTGDGHLKLAKFCEEEGLFEEAVVEYEAAIRLAPDMSSAKRGLDKLRLSLEFPVNPALFRLMRPRMNAAAKFLRMQQNEDGTFGDDARYYGVAGWRAMTCISVIALMCQWEFEMLHKPDAPREVPKEIATALELVLENKHPVQREGLRGPDIWGPIFEIDLLARISRKQYMSRYHARVRKRMPGAVTDLTSVVKSDGGYMYYDFVRTSGSFSTAAAILNMLNAKNSGFEIDPAVLDNATKILAKLQFGEGTFNYHEEGGDAGMNPSNSPVGASARSPMCDGALMAMGVGNEKSLMRATLNFFNYRHILAEIKGQAGTHIGKGMVAPYYFFFGHYYTTRVIRLLEPRLQRIYINEMAKWMCTYQDMDGSFWDWKGEGVPWKVYGTALAMMTMYHICSTERDPALGQVKIPPPVTPEPTPTTPGGANPDKPDVKPPDPAPAPSPDPPPPAPDSPK